MYYEIFEELKNTIIDNLPEVTTCKIGLEDGISATDTPFVRIVPVEDEIDTTGFYAETNVNIVVGTMQLANLESTYQVHLDLKKKLIDLLDGVILSKCSSQFVGAVYDSDEVENFKISLLNFKLGGIEL